MSWNKNIVLLFAIFAISNSFGQADKSAADFLRMPTEIGFGKIQLGETKRIVVEVVNISKDTIELEYFTNNCTCLNVIHLNHKGIVPNITDSIVILYKPKRIGYIEEQLSLYVKDVSNPLFFKLKGRVVCQKITR